MLCLFSYSIFMWSPRIPIAVLILQIRKWRPKMVISCSREHQYIFLKCCFDPVLRLWLDTSQFSFLVSWLNPYSNHQPYWYLTFWVNPFILIAQGPGTRHGGQSLWPRTYWNYPNKQILSLLNLLHPFLLTETTIKSFIHKAPPPSAFRLSLVILLSILVTMSATKGETPLNPDYFLILPPP